MVKQAFFTITNEEIYKEIKDLQDKQQCYATASTKIQTEILDQAKYTNGRVTKLENKSVWMWIGNHPFKFAVIVLSTVSLLQLDIPTLLKQFL